MVDNDNNIETVITIRLINMNNNKDHKELGKELGIFDKISNKYREKSTVQQKAAEKNWRNGQCYRYWLWTWTYYSINQ